LPTDSIARILIVEDFDDLRKIIVSFLNARGYEVVEAATGRAAIQAAINHNPRLVLLDVHLPDISGAEVVRELRKSPQTKDVAIIGWSADSGSQWRGETLQYAGITDYVQKPITLKELNDVINRFLPNSKIPR
jgi:CheY-like chemotaxis protein